MDLAAEMELCTKLLQYDERNCECSDSFWGLVASLWMVLVLILARSCATHSPLLELQALGCSQGQGASC